VIDASALFDGWRPIARTLVVGLLGYATLVTMLRVSGKRTLAKLNAFDLVVTVALGSTFASVLTDRDLSLATGATAFATLIGLQFALAWGQTRSGRLRRLVKSEPRLLLHRGEPLRDAMRRERITEDELRAALRAAGLERLAEAHAVVLETDGSLSVAPRGADGGAAA
jgi:uncharacterized membrane protein YcaP (DUF421 family)